MTQLQKLWDKNEKRLNDLEHKHKILSKSTDAKTLELIDKWTDVCKDSIHDLKNHMESKNSSQKITIGDILSGFHIDPEHLNYDKEEDDFL